MRNWQQALGGLIVAALVGITSGCAAEPPEPDQPVATSPPPMSPGPMSPGPMSPAPISPAPAPDAPVDGCPVLPAEADGPTGSSMIIDYVDFVEHDGRQYIAGLSEVSPVSSTQLGDVVLRSKCSFSALNDSTHLDPGSPRDGDTAFLPPGTAIHAVDGWGPECRLAAERDGQVYVYLAQEPNTERARPAPCALD